MSAGCVHAAAVQTGVCTSMSHIGRARGCSGCEDVGVLFHTCQLLLCDYAYDVVCDRLPQDALSRASIATHASLLNGIVESVSVVDTSVKF